jgi:hypothetical protein
MEKQVFTAFTAFANSQQKHHCTGGNGIASNRCNGPQVAPDEKPQAPAGAFDGDGVRHLFVFPDTQLTAAILNRWPRDVKKELWPAAALQRVGFRA